MKKDLGTPRYLSVPDAAAYCGVSRNTVFTWVKKGELKAYQTPGRVNMIRPIDLVEFMKKSGLFVPGELSEMAHEDEKRSTPVEAADGSTAGRKILIVDDEPAVRTIMVRALRPVASIYQAETGFEALHLLTLQRDIAVAILDLHMPGQHGLKTLMEIKNLRPDVLIVIVTGYENEIPPELIRNGTVAAVMKKPFELEDLRRKAAELMGLPT